MKKPEQNLENQKKPPEISPYVFPVLLAAFGLWAFYDGWLTRDPEMLKHALFNRVISVVLLPWAVYDFLKVRKYERRQKEDDSVDSENETDPK